MPTPIIIREVSKKGKKFAASVQFDLYGTAYEISVTPPFTQAQEERLEWYFEKWLTFPFTDKVPAEEAAKSIRTYGEELFAQVFRANPDVYLEYQRLRQGDILLEIIGSPEFHTLHWEALKDPHQERPLSVDKPLVRKNSQPVTYRAEVKAAEQLRVLLVAARPGGKTDVGYRTISQPLVKALETGRIRAQIDIVRPGTFEALVNHLEDTRDTHGDGYYHIIHLDMHGALLTHAEYQTIAKTHPTKDYLYGSGDFAQKEVAAYEGVKAFLLFDQADGKEDAGGNLVSAEDLAALLNMRQIPIVVLNACQSGKQVGESETSLGSRLLAAGVQLVVAMGYSVTVSAARLLMSTLYRQLLEGKEPSVAIRRGRLELYNDKRRRASYGQEIRLEDWLLPVIYQNTPPVFEWEKHPNDILLEETVYKEPQTTYGFVGRDMDILAIEKRLLHHSNLLLVRGMGGAGKTTLLQHLGWWWQKTRFVGQVCYFGYDLKAYHLQEIVSVIGKQLGLALNGIAAHDRALILHALKSTRHLLILDNMESITGENLAVLNTLPPSAQAELRDFLQELSGSKTLVLLGSRGAEEWLTPNPLRKDAVYDLPGLDPESRTLLAEAILRGVQAPDYPQMPEHSDAFQHLLKLLGGYPLAMEVVLANLAAATPKEVIERLQAADINLDNQQEAADKTKSILKCIDYSHSNLSPDAQQLLSCLSPFTGVIRIDWLPQYTEQLKQQPALAALPFERWQQVLQEARKWGLLQPHEELAGTGYWRIQPIFPYFLKTRLNDPSQLGLKAAIETAFREHYSGIGDELWQLIESKDADERQTGQVLIGVEYENLVTALQLALKQNTSILNLYFPVSRYLERVQGHQQGLELGNRVLSALENYPMDYLQGEIALEFIGIIDNIAKRELSLKQYTSAKAAYERTLTLHDAHFTDKTDPAYGKRAGILHQLGRVAEEQRQWPAAEASYKEALQILIDFNDRFSQAKTLHHLGIVAEEQHRWPAAEAYFKEALQIKIDFKDRFSQAATLHNLGVVAQAQRQWPAAETYYNEALQIKIDFKNRYEQASTLHQLGNVAEEQRQWPAAKAYYNEALQIFIDFKARYEQAGILHQLGTVAYKQRQWSAAEAYYKEALQIKIDFNDRYGQASTLHQLGRVAEEQRQWPAAEATYKEALQIKIDFKDRYAQASTLHQLGRVAEEQSQWPAAEGYYKEALQIYIDFKDRYEQAGTLHQLGIAAQEQRQWPAAEGYYKEALQIFIDFKDRYEQAGTLGQLGLLAEAQEDWAQAVNYTLQTAEIFYAYQDPQLGIALRALARLRKTSGNAPGINSQLAEALKVSVEEADQFLNKFEDTDEE
jgi:tetratricopeptide (TPR) repeat protein